MALGTGKSLSFMTSCTCHLQVRYQEIHSVSDKTVGARPSRSFSLVGVASPRTPRQARIL